MTDGPLPHRENQRSTGERHRGSVRADPPGVPPARSALGLRRVLALFGMVFCGVMAGVFAVAGWPLPSALLALLAVVAIIDLVVIRRRIHASNTDR